MERGTPETDPERFDIHKYNVENRVEPGRMGKFWGVFRGKPNLGLAAKAGDPSMTTLMPSTPPGIQTTAAAAAAAVAPTADVTVETITGPSALDTEPDARLSPPQAESEQQDEPE